MRVGQLIEINKEKCIQSLETVTLIHPWGEDAP